MKKFIVTLLLFITIGLKGFADNKPYRFNDMFSISVSDKLELRQQSDAYTKILRDTLKYVSNAQIVFQQKGLSRCTEDAYNHYCRIMFQTYADETYSLPYSDEFTLAQNEIQELVDACKDELAHGQEFVSSPTYTIEATDNGHKFLRINYMRTGDNGNVNVDICYFLNYTQLVKGIFSYRVSEAHIWQMVLKDAMNSFTWSTPYVRISKPDIDYTGIFVMVIAIFVLSRVVWICIKEDKPKRKEIIDISESFPNDIFNILDKEIRELEKIQKSDKQSPQIGYYKEFSSHSYEEAKTSVKTTIPLKPKTVTSRAEKETPKVTIPCEKEIYVKYSLPSNNPTNYYCYYVAPQKGGIVFPYRARKVERRGYTERTFQYRLKQSLAIYRNYKVLGNVSILPAEGYHPYEPDITIVEVEDRFGLRIDIEIDEPYGGLDKTPIHYIGCGDELRDKNLANIGWMVIRFSEKQIHNEADLCINYIKYIISQIDKNVTLLNKSFPTPDKRWTELEAKLKAATKYREKLLCHEFGNMEKDVKEINVTQTEQEKKVASQVRPLDILRVKRNLDKSSLEFSQDSKLHFEPKEHKYTYNGTRSLTPVSQVLEKFFPVFDSFAKAKEVAYRRGCDMYELLDEWECNGAESREVGTFLHAQIEAYFSNEPVQESTRFIYKGEHIRENRIVSIREELKYFKNFLKENPITPFRTKWHICDLNLGIAGTVDLLCRNGICFDLYDWKRSKKADPNEVVWNYGINGLENIPNIDYYHYAIKQNLYRYILEKNYGIKIANMYIVVLHPINGKYVKYPIKRMEKEIQIIVNKLS